MYSLSCSRQILLPILTVQFPVVFQVEMCLLGQALQLTLRVFRPSQVEQEDFVSHYPDHMLDVWEQVDLIAEDDRHYNIVVN